MLADAKDRERIINHMRRVVGESQFWQGQIADIDKWIEEHTMFVEGLDNGLYFEKDQERKEQFKADIQQEVEQKIFSAGRVPVLEEGNIVPSGGYIEKSAKHMQYYPGPLFMYESRG
jgi:hypothetical protein